MRDRERGTRWMNVAHIHEPSCRHFAAAVQNPRRMPRLFDIRADARRRPRRRVSWRGTDRDDAGMDAGFAAHFRDFASFACGLDFGGDADFQCELSFRRRIAPYKQAGNT